MKVLSLIQGSRAWHEHRAHSRNASEARTVLGVIEHETRAAMLLRKKTGIAPEVSPWQQKIFDAGHAVEPALREFAENIIGEDLAPMVCTTDDGYLSASFDGLTMMFDTIVEVKQGNQEKIAYMRATGMIPEIDVPQVAQQFAVCDTAERVIYVCGDGTRDGTESVIVTRKELANVIAKLRPAWEQFDADLVAYQPEPEAAPAPTGHAPETLPTLEIQISGGVQTTNLPEFRERALWLIRNVKRDLQTDTDFADAEQTVKWCADIESRLKQAKERALSQTASIDELFRTIDDISAEARRTRLELDKLVKSEKQNRKAAIVLAATQALTAHYAALNKRWITPKMPAPEAQWLTAIKGKSSLANIQDAIDAELARCKIEGNRIADLIDANNKVLIEVAAGYEGLFRDARELLLKPTEDVRSIAAGRVAEARAAAEAERLRIRAEEEAKARAEAEAEQVRTRAAEAEFRAAQEAAEKPKLADMRGIAIAAHIKQQAPAAPDEGPSTKPTLTLGAINERLAPISISGAGMAQFDLEPLATEKRAKLYSEDQFGTLLCELLDHLNRVNAKVYGARREAEVA